MKKYRCWHFINENRTLGYDAADLTVEPGYVYSIEDDRSPELCDYGMHGSVRPIDALYYAPGPIACLVDVWGDVIVGDDKLVGRHRQVVAVVDATRILHEFACWCVRHTPLGDGRVAWDLLTDERSRAAVETKERWLCGEATDAELTAAGAAAWAAAGAAKDAAWAAKAAAWAAAGAAKDAARAAAGAAQNTQLETMLRKALSDQRRAS